MAYRCYMREELDACARRSGARREAALRRPLASRDAGRAAPAGRAGDPLRTRSTASVAWDDLVHGRIGFPNAELDDLVLRVGRDADLQLLGGVDDLAMRITHVIRGDDHMNNTPRQINMFGRWAPPPPRVRACAD